MSYTARNKSMAGRIGWGVLIASLLLQSRSTFGQGYPPGGGYRGIPVHSAGAQTPYDQAVPPGTPYSGAGYPSGGYMMMGQQPGCPTGDCPPGGGSRFVNNRIYDDDAYEPSPFERALQTATRNSWFRLEYLNWTIEDADETLLGTRTTLTTNPRAPFLTNGGIARVLDTEPLSFNDKNGLRGTIGIPLTFGEFEVSAFLLEQGSDKIVPGNIPNPGQFIGTTVFVDGIPGTAVRVYDKSFKASFTSDVWGGEANIILNTAPAGEGFKLRPLYGARYLGIQEQFTQVGTFNGAGSFTDFTSVIDSDNFNNIYGMNFGFQAELVHRWFTIGARPKVMLGANSWQARVTTNRFVSQTDPTRIVQIDGTDFAAVGELALYGKVHVNDSLTLFVSYNLLWATNVIRPHKSIRYNVDTFLGIPQTSAFSTKEVFEDMKVYGLTVGGEFRFH